MRRVARTGTFGLARRRAALAAQARAWLAVAPATAVGLATALACGGCERGCTRDWLAERGLGAPTPTAPGPMPLNAVDCPDGLARCEEGVVSASRLATVPMPCRSPSADCACPWDRVGECATGCLAEGAEVVLERARATAQLCEPAPNHASFANPLGSPPAGGSPAPAEVDAFGETGATCDEGDRYRCAGGRVVECASGSPVAQCVRGCSSEGASIDDDAVSREAAFAILCSR
jgi:hypothetical protein